MLIDTHCHLNFAAYRDDLDAVIQRTRDEHVRVINVGSQYSTSQRAVKLAKEHPGQMFAAVGLHPIHLFDMDVDEGEDSFHTRREEFKTEDYAELAQAPGVVAIGEMGIDYYHKPTGISDDEFIQKQKWTFIKAIQLAQKINKPIIIHTRGAKADPARAYVDMLELITEANFSNAVVHCFTEDWVIAKKILDAGLMISFTGIITFPKTHKLEEVVKKTPLDSMMVETDSPYLAPQLVRGKRNEPRYVRYVVDRIAQIKGLSYEEVEVQTTKNAETFFKLPG
ncbi:MAG: TatD family hydrolase [Candidatus Kerfeldbacteria bacterium]|nr:TatD family hydrolase [Candidatus Kerfeldbacteria bacterium]